jgi:hypothetical protein
VKIFGLVVSGLCTVLVAGMSCAQQSPNPTHCDLNLIGPKTKAQNVSATQTVLGLDGIDIIPLGGYRGTTFLSSTMPTHPTYALVGFASAINALGSGAFGPATPDVAGLFSTTKTNYLSSAVEGELDTVFALAHQGRRGDVATFLGSAVKVKTGTTVDTGSALGSELRAAWVDSSGTTLNDIHTLSPLMESSNGVSGGSGYGTYTESFHGTNYAGFYAGATPSVDPTTGFRYAFIAASDRSTAGQYFRITGNRVSGLSQPGDIVQGVPETSKTIRNSNGTLQVRNTADNATLLSITDAGVVTMPSDPAWTSYTPTLGCGSGTLKSASAIGKYKSFGKTADIRITITITTIGTCATSLNASLPHFMSGQSVLPGRDNNSGKMLQGSTGGAGSGTVFITDFANSFPFTSADTVVVNGTYEIQ